MRRGGGLLRWGYVWDGGNTLLLDLERLLLSLFTLMLLILLIILLLLVLLLLLLLII